jgi:hypothetical protein
MPLGNLTSQFFANIYLNELDQFVKHKLKSKYYIRYVDDFVLLHSSKEQLINWKKEIEIFLKEKLKLKLHSEKSKILDLYNGINFLGFRNFYHYRLLKKSNLKNFERNFNKNKRLFKLNLINEEKFIDSFEGWLAYAKNGNTHKYRNHLLKEFNHSPILKPINQNNKKYYNLKKKFEKGELEFSVQKTLFLWLKDLGIKEISELRSIKESTVWKHLENLIKYNQLSILDILPKDKIHKIITKIKSKKDSLKIIKCRLKSDSISSDEIACVLASLKK